MYSMKVLITEKEIREKVCELSKIIAKESRTRNLHILFVLKGSFIFCADLIRALNNHKVGMTIDYISAKSYVGTRSTGKIKLSMNIDIKGKEVLLVEDIIDTGRTLKKIKKELVGKKPIDLKIVCLLDKQSRREVDIEADYVGFTIEDRFVVGYGLDCDENYRFLPFIAELSENLSSKIIEPHHI